MGFSVMTFVATHGSFDHLAVTSAPMSAPPVIVVQPKGMMFACNPSPSASLATRLTSASCLQAHVGSCCFYSTWRWTKPTTGL